MNADLRLELSYQTVAMITLPLDLCIMTVADHDLNAAAYQMMGFHRMQPSRNAAFSACRLHNASKAHCCMLIAHAGVPSPPDSVSHL